MLRDKETGRWWPGLEPQGQSAYKHSGTTNATNGKNSLEIFTFPAPLTQFSLNRTKTNYYSFQGRVTGLPTSRVGTASPSSLPFATFLGHKVWAREKTSCPDQGSACAGRTPASCPRRVMRQTRPTWDCAHISWLSWHAGGALVC